MAPTSEPFLRAGAGLPAVYGKHVLLAKLATGGMGEVFLARMRGAAGFEKLLVLKRLLPHLSEQPRFVSMFLDEARLAARISHANVCQIYELGQVEDQYYITMEYLEGAQLSQVIERRRLDPRLAELRLVCAVLGQVCEGLHAAHDLRNDNGELLGVVHRDVCLSNIFVTWSGVAKLIDFGVAKARGALSKTRPGAVKGTYAYMSPEQLRGEEVLPRSDVFSLGVVAWEAITGRRLFKRKTDFQTFKAITEEPIPLASELRSDVPPSLARVVRRALERDPTRRYQSARELGRALDEGTRSLGPPMVALAIAEVVRESFSADIDRHRARIAAIYRGADGKEDKEFDTTATEEMPLGARRRLDTDADDDAQRVTHPVIRMPLPAPATATGNRPAPEVLAEADVEAEPPTEEDEEEEETRASPLRRKESPPVDDDTTDFEIFDEESEVEMEMEVEVEATPPDESIRPRRRPAVPLLLAGIVATVAVIAYMLVRDRRTGIPAPPSAAGKAASVQPQQAGPSAPVQPDRTPLVEAIPPSEALAPDAGAVRASTRVRRADAGVEVASAPAEPADAAPAALPAASEPDAGTTSVARDETGSDHPEPSKPKRPKTHKPKVKKPAAETTSHAKAQEPGQLTVDSAPYATIFLDDKKLGYTPIVGLRVAAGKHTLRAVSSADGRERTLTITVKSGKHLRRKLKW